MIVQEAAPRVGRQPKDIRIDVIGPKPGEKLYEELMTDEEVRHTIELERYFVVKPAFSTRPASADAGYPGVVNAVVTNPYRSSAETSMDADGIRALLIEAGVFSEDAP